MSSSSQRLVIYTAAVIGATIMGLLAALQLPLVLFGFVFLLVIGAFAVSVSIYLQGNNWQNLSARLFWLKARNLRWLYRYRHGDGFYILSMTVDANQPRTKTGGTPFDAGIGSVRKELAKQIQSQLGVSVLGTHAWQVDMYRWRNNAKTPVEGKIYFFINGGTELDISEFTHSIVEALKGDNRLHLRSVMVDGIGIDRSETVDVAPPREYEPEDPEETLARLL